jgi:hypothetical protein
VRRQLGYCLHETEPRIMGGGILVHGLNVWPSNTMSIDTEGDLHYFVLPRADGSARLYQLFRSASVGASLVRIANGSCSIRSVSPACRSARRSPLQLLLVPLPSTP